MTKRTKKSKPKLKSTDLRLDGSVSVVETYSDGTEKSEEIEGKLVLQLVLQAIKDGLNSLELKKGK